MWNVSFCEFCLRLDSERPSHPLEWTNCHIYPIFFNALWGASLKCRFLFLWGSVEKNAAVLCSSLHRRHMGCGGSGSVAPSFPPCCFSRMLDIAQEDKRSQLMTCLGTLIASVLIVPLCIWRGQQCTRGTRSSQEKVRKLNISATDERKWYPFVCARSIFGIVDLF